MKYHAACTLATREGEKTRHAAGIAHHAGTAGQACMPRLQQHTHILAWATLLHWHPPGCDETDIVTGFESRVTQLSLHVLLAVHKGVPLMK